MVAGSRASRANCFFPPFGALRAGKPAKPAGRADIDGRRPGSPASSPSRSIDPEVLSRLVNRGVQVSKPNNRLVEGNPNILDSLMPSHGRRGGWIPTVEVAYLLACPPKRIDCSGYGVARDKPVSVVEVLVFELDLVAVLKQVSVVEGFCYGIRERPPPRPFHRLDAVATVLSNLGALNLQSRKCRPKRRDGANRGEPCWDITPVHHSQSLGGSVRITVAVDGHRGRCAGG